jgi:Amt family ammonium transporter
MLAGLVAVTCPCYWVSPLGAFIIGAVGGVVVVVGCDLLEHLRIDDPCGATAVHGFAGIWGTLSLGLFACGYGVTGPFGADVSAPLTGLFYGGGWTVLAAQGIGSLIVTVVTLGVALAMYFGIKAMGHLRVSRSGEMQGLDLYEHGIPAYPEYELHAAASPRGTLAFNSSAFTPSAPEKEVVHTS